MVSLTIIIKSYQFETNLTPLYQSLVPNVNIQYREVLIIEWDHETVFQQNCGECCDGMPKLVEVRNEQNIPIMDFPSSVTWEIENTNDGAFAFYTRSHLIYYKMPELRVLIRNQEDILNRVSNREILCCNVVGQGTCVIESENTRTCIRDDVDFEQTKLQALTTSLTSWEKFLEELDNSTPTAFSNFFNDDSTITNDKVDSRKSVLKHLEIRSQPHTLVKPETLKQAEANSYARSFKEEYDIPSDNDWLTGVNRIQIEGNAGE